MDGRALPLAHETLHVERTVKTVVLASLPICGSGSGAPCVFLRSFVRASLSLAQRTLSS
jgi:hypothetical protein